MNSNVTKYFLLALAVTLTGVVTSGVGYADTAGAALTKEAQAAITPARALEMLKQGNERFVSGNPVERDLMQLRARSVSGPKVFLHRFLY